MKRAFTKSSRIPLLLRNRDTITWHINIPIRYLCSHQFQTSHVCCFLIVSITFVIMLRLSFSLLLFCFQSSSLVPCISNFSLCIEMFAIRYSSFFLHQFGVYVISLWTADNLLYERAWTIRAHAFQLLIPFEFIEIRCEEIDGLVCFFLLPFCFDASDLLVVCSPFYVISEQIVSVCWQYTRSECAIKLSLPK